MGANLTKRLNKKESVENRFKEMEHRLDYLSKKIDYIQNKQDLTPQTSTKPIRIPPPIKIPVL
jgi:hypothetical protein